MPDDTLVLALSGTISHKREQPSPGPFELATADGSATAGADYTALNTLVSFAAGDVSKTVTIDITNDDVFEGAEDFSIALSGASGATISATKGSVTTTINDDGTGGPPGADDDTPELSIVGPVEVNEAAGTITYTVAMSNPSASDVTVDVATSNGSATAGSDYAAVSQALTCSLIPRLVRRVGVV